MSQVRLDTKDKVNVTNDSKDVKEDLNLAIPGVDTLLTNSNDNNEC